MGIVFNGGVINSGGTPQAITGVIADIPLAANVSEGTIFISTDTQEIFSAQSGSWINVSGGGGGSQNLDQVLAVGNTGIDKDINLWDVAISPQQVLAIKNNIAENGIFLNKSQGNEDYEIIIFNEFPAQLQVLRYTLKPTSDPNIFTQLNYGSDVNGKNEFYVRAFNGSNTIFRRFVVNASYSGGNSTELLDENSGDYLYVKTEADLSVGLPIINLRSSFSGTVQDCNITEQYIQYFNSAIGGTYTTIYPYIDSGSNLIISFPEFSGKMANVNERIIDLNVDLSAGNYDCNQYGVYVVNVGSNTNTFDLFTFVNNGVDGQFVTICANDLPINCTNTAGIIVGNANISSNGLFKLMKIGNDIYSSNL